MDMAKWKDCELKELPIELYGQPVYVGFDMSAKTDLTSVTFMIPYLYRRIRWKRKRNREVLFLDT